MVHWGKGLVQKYEVLAVAFVVMAFIIIADSLTIASGMSIKITGFFTLLYGYLPIYLPYAIVAVCLLVAAGFMLRIANNQKENLTFKCTDKEKKPLLLSLNEGAVNFEDSRKEIWSSYHSKIQDHTGYALTTLIALIGLVAGSNFLPAITFLAILVWTAFSVGVVFFAWLILRILYWSIWAGSSLLLSEEQIVMYFNFCNARCQYYECKDTNTSASAIIQIAVKQHLIDVEKRMKWSFSTFFRKLAILTGGIAGIPTYAEPSLPPDKGLGNN